MKIAELKVGTSFSDRFVIAGAEVRTTKTNKPYLYVTITDGTDSISGMDWNWRKPSAPETGLAYDISANVSEYQGSKQISVQSIALSENQDMSAFQACYCTNPAEAYNQALQAISQIDNEGLRNICEYVYNTYKQQLITSTSAVGVHHVGIGGNIVHTMEVYAHAKRIAEYYRDRVSVDLCCAGALLHDIGKPETYMMNGPVIEYTEAGHLFDHIVLGLEILNEANAATGFVYNSTVELLKHIIISHHGQREYGSPVTPKFMEAYIVNMADGISATLDTLWSANVKAQREGKAMTDKLWTMGNQPHILQDNVAKRLNEDYTKS